MVYLDVEPVRVIRHLVEDCELGAVAALRVGADGPWQDY